MPTTLSQELQDKIKKIKERQDKIASNLDSSKKGVKTALADSVMKVMSSDDFLNNQDYLDYYNQYATATTITGPVEPKDLRSRQKKFIEQLSKDEQINLLAEYSIDAEREEGHNDWEKELLDAQKAKEVTKKAVAVQAKSVIESFKSLTVEHEKLITELKGKVKDKKSEIDKLDDKIDKKNAQITANNETLKAAKNSAPSQEQITLVETSNNRLIAEIDELKKERETLQAELLQLESDLTSMEEQKDIYKAAIENAISELEESLKMDGIYVGSYEGLGEKSSSETENEESVNMQGGSTVQGGIDERKSKDIAKAMMTDFRNLAPEEIMEMVEHTGYGDLLNMSRELGPINRRNFDRVIQNRLEEMGVKIGTSNGRDVYGLKAKIKDKDGNPETIRITLDKLLNLSQMDKGEFTKIKELMKYYTDNYQDMAVHERKEAEEIMNYLKIATLLTESKQGAIGRFVGRFSARGTRINEIGNSLRRFATERGKRQSRKWERNQDIRTRLAFKTPIPSTTRKKHIERSGKKPIQREIVD